MAASHRAGRPTTAAASGCRRAWHGSRFGQSARRGCWPDPTSLLSGAHGTNPNYAYSGGTWIATPLTAGVGRWCGTGSPPRPREPSAADVKATLLDTTAAWRPDSTERVPRKDDSSANNVPGWGRADLAFMNAPAPYAYQVNNHGAIIAANDVVTYAIRSAHPLQVLEPPAAARDARLDGSARVAVHQRTARQRPRPDGERAQRAILRQTISRPVTARTTSKA